MRKNDNHRFIARLVLWGIAAAISLTLSFFGYTNATAQGNITASADVLIDPNNPTTNYNAGQPGGGRLETTYSNFPNFMPTRRALLQFDLSGISTTLSASPLLLGLVENALAPGSAVDLSLYAVDDDSWDERSVTASSAPTTGSLLQTIEIAAGTANRQLQFNAAAVGAYLEAQRTGDGTASFLLRLDNGTGDLGFGGNLIFEDREGSDDGVNGNEPHIVTAVTQLGNCNGDTAVDAGDLNALVLEIFDGDGMAAADVAGGTFAGQPGCDANTDGLINAGDIVCTVQRIFNIPNACAGVTNAVNRAVTTRDGTLATTPLQVM